MFILPRIFKKTKTKRFNLILLISIVTQVFLLRYYKGVRSREYLITFYAYFIVFTGLLLYHLKKYKFVFVILTGFCVVSSLLSCQKIIGQKSQAQEILSIYNQIQKDKIDFYNLNSSSQLNLPLFYLFYRQNRLDEQVGYKIGTCQPSEEVVCPSADLIIASSKNYQVYDLNSYTVDQLLPYFQFTPEIVYNWLYINYPDAKKF